MKYKNIIMIALLLSVFINIFSIYNLSKNLIPTLYALIFGYSLFFMSGILYYIFNRKRSMFYIFQESYYNISKIFQIFFYIIIILILIDLTKSLYTKSLIYYLLIALATVIITIQILLNKCSSYSSYNILFLQIIPLSIIIRGSSFTINTYLIGPDVPWHFNFIQQIIKNGQLDPSAGHYYYYPFYHIIQSISGVIIGFSENYFNIINIFISIISIIIIFLIGKCVYDNRRAGLICALFLTISTMSIFSVIYNTSKIGGISLFLLTLFLLIKTYTHSHKRYIIGIFWLSAIGIFFWHPEISFAIMVILGADLIVYIFTRREIILHSKFTIYLIAYITYMIHVNTQLFSTIIQGIFIDRQEVPSLTQNFVGDVNIRFISQLSTSYIGITLPTFLVSYSVLKWLNGLNKIRLLFLSSLILLHIIPFIGIISGNFAINPERTLVYVSIMLIIIASGTISDISFSNKSYLIIFMIIVFIFSFFSVSSYLTGDGNEIFNNEIPIQKILTTRSNAATFNFLNKTPEQNNIIGDDQTVRLFRRFPFALQNRSIYVMPSSYINGYFVANKPNLKMLRMDNPWDKGIYDIYLFNSTKISENINDGKLTEFLRENYDIKIEQIKKINNIITISTKIKNYTLINNKNNSITILDGDIKIDEFIIKSIGDKLYFEKTLNLLYNNGDILVYE